MSEEMEQVSRIVRDAENLLNDAAERLADFRASLDYSPQEYDELESRLSFLRRLQRKGLVFLALERRSGSFLSMLTAGIAGEAVMVAGYYVFEALILQSALAAAAGVVPNILQGTAGIAGALVLMPALRKALRFRSAAKR